MHEENLLKRMARGEPEAAEELVRRFYPEILRHPGTAAAFVSGSSHVLQASEHLNQNKSASRFCG